MKFWINLAGYELVWFSNVIGAEHRVLWPGLLALLVYAAWQLAVSRQRRADLQLIATALASGCVLDGTLLNTGLIRYTANLPFAVLPPVWILALWVSFALTFTQALKYLQTRLWLAAALGAIGGPLAYLGAARGWKVVSFEQPAWLGLMALAIGWGIATPLLAWLARRWSYMSTANLNHVRGPAA